MFANSTSLRRVPTELIGSRHLSLGGVPIKLDVLAFQLPIAAIDLPLTDISTEIPLQVRSLSVRSFSCAVWKSFLDLERLTENVIVQISCSGCVL
jgi:hypothetical protein